MFNHAAIVAQMGPIKFITPAYGFGLGDKKVKPLERPFNSDVRGTKIGEFAQRMQSVPWRSINSGKLLLLCCFADDYQWLASCDNSASRPPLSNFAHVANNFSSFYFLSLAHRLYKCKSKRSATLVVHCEQTKFAWLAIKHFSYFRRFTNHRTWKQR